jgi:hypothetical protein
MRPFPKLAVVLLAVLAVSEALAQKAPVRSGTRVQLRVGQKKVLNVGLAMGLACDDTTVVQAELRTVSPEENALVLVGLKAGKTACRAGTADLAGQKLVYVSVSP